MFFIYHGFQWIRAGFLEHIFTSQSRAHADPSTAMVGWVVNRFMTFLDPRIASSVRLLPFCESRMKLSVVLPLIIGVYEYFVWQIDIPPFFNHGCWHVSRKSHECNISGWRSTKFREPNFLLPLISTVYHSFSELGLLIETQSGCIYILASLFGFVLLKRMITCSVA